jgi:hypothetical protein
VGWFAGFWVAEVEVVKVKYDGRREDGAWKFTAQAAAMIRAHKRFLYEPLMSRGVIFHINFQP